jgi:hypothetical protein
MLNSPANIGLLKWRRGELNPGPSMTPMPLLRA